MTDIKLYAELHYAEILPNIQMVVNNQTLIPTNTTSIQVNECQRNVIISYQETLATDNKLEIIMDNQPTQNFDQLINNSIDHWVKVRELEIDGIKFKPCLYNACEFRPNLDDPWIRDITSRGYCLDETYPHATDIKFNGSCIVHFTTPIWQWCSERFTK